MLSLWTLAAALATGSAADERYLEDFEFVRDTVQQHGAAVTARKIDWKKECARLRSRFRDCTSDSEHVANVMQLLAVLQDGHTGVTRSSVSERPSKWVGLYGAGLWVAVENGRVTVRDLMHGHPHDAALPPGTAVVSFEGMPMAWVLELQTRRITRHFGVSSLHHLYATMGARFFPFGEKDHAEIGVVRADGSAEQLRISRWGPGGKAYPILEETMPDGVESGPGAVSGWLDESWGEKVGYLRITGKMDTATRDAYHAAFDALEGMSVLLLDCRGMGGGSDSSAWEMAGRLFSERVPNGAHGSLEPSGSWQFDGPVLMLQDEREVSAAETFTWAVSETERVVSVGRSTGGWAIIPRLFECPSGLCSFRLGTRNRPTPIRSILTEGVGWPADIPLPRSAPFAKPEGEIEAARWILRALAADATRKDVITAFTGLLGASPKKFQSAARRWQKDEWPLDPAELYAAVEAGLRDELALEVALLGVDGPDVAGSRGRHRALAPRARAFGLGDELAAWKKALDGLRKEEAAQLGASTILDDDLQIDDDALQKWLRKHGKTSWGRLLAERHQ